MNDIKKHNLYNQTVTLTNVAANVHIPQVFPFLSVINPFYPHLIPQEF